MAILKTAGAVLFIIGVLLGIYTIVTAKKTRLFEDMAELKRIRENCYTKEHHEEERREDIYKREPAAPQARLMSRRAKRVLERMNEAENASQNDSQEESKGKAVLEEVVPKGQTPEAPVKYESVEAAPGSRTGGFQRKVRRKKTYAAENEPALPKHEDGTDVLEGSPIEYTGILQSPLYGSGESQSAAPAEGTDVLVQAAAEGTDILNAAPEEGTDILRRDASEGTDILRRPQKKTADNPMEDYGEGTDILDSSAAAAGISGQSYGEGTDILERPTDEGADILRKEPSEDTDILVRPREAEAAGVPLQPQGEGTDILPSSARSARPQREEGTDILHRAEEEATDILVPSRQAGFAVITDEPMGNEEGTDILDPSPEDTDVLNTSESTDILERR